MAFHINHLAVWAAAVVYFFIGGLWYAPFLFGKKWMALNSMSEVQRLSNIRDKGGIGVFLMLAFAGGVVSLYAVSCILAIGQIHTALGGATAGLLIGLAFGFVTTGVSNLFSARPFALTLIDAGHEITAFTVCGAIIGAW